MKSYIVILIIIETLAVKVLYAQKISAHKNLQHAIDLIDQNKEEEAFLYLNECLYEQPENQEALFLRARILNNKEKYLEALTDYNKLLALDPENKEALYNRGNLRFQLQQYNMAKEDFQKCMEIPIKETNTAYFKIDPSSQKASGISTINLMDVDIWNHIGLCHFKINEIPASIQAYNNGLEIENNNTDLLINRAIAHEKNGEEELAQVDYKAVLTIDPDNTIAQLNLLRMTSSHISYSELDKFIDNHPDNPGGYVERGHAYYNSRDYLSAEKDFITALKLDPDNQENSLNLALVKIKLSQLDEAEKILIQVAENNQGNDRIFFNLGNICYQKNLLVESISYYTLAIQLAPINASYFYNRGLAYYENRQIEKACEDMKAALDLDSGLDPDFSEKYCTNH